MTARDSKQKVNDLQPNRAIKATYLGVAEIGEKTRSLTLGVSNDLILRMELEGDQPSYNISKISSSNAKRSGIFDLNFAHMGPRSSSRTKKVTLSHQRCAEKLADTQTQCKPSALCDTYRYRVVSGHGNRMLFITPPETSNERPEH